MMLLKIDRTYMANSVEARSPFVDHRLVEYLLSTDYKVSDRKRAKYILKELLLQDFDKSFIDRKKWGSFLILRNGYFQMRI